MPIYCKYHTNDGCKLTLFKPPFCIGFICNHVEEFLRKSFPCKAAELFIDDLKHLTDFASYFIYRESLSYSEYFKEIFETMDIIIENGKKLVEIKDIKESYSL